ncbi:MAG: hypothetical protein WC755_06450 [Candidatus Woesearchaeota archaeon]|jgi:small-conductance mechanosensitive channel
MGKYKKITKIVLSKLVGFAIFILIWLVMNFLTRYIGDATYNYVVSFFNLNFVLLLVMSLLFLFGELLSFVPFPLNLPAPVFNAAASFFLVGFIFDVFRFVDVQFAIGELLEFLTFEPMVKIIVILIVLVVGYVKLFCGVFCKSKKCCSDDSVDEKEDSNDDNKELDDEKDDYENNYDDDDKRQEEPKKRTRRKRR